ncbi:hypothetical protein V2H45_06045 [Tumidithrix elongata RA019]|uniref:DUF2281 domain-containing protein n=1 Tax=Tumidithrix elongata BACA0141 TaxID=2716417 RepID=A0AAW9PR42_9CYAN|nr:hypothetical protein [Tumidithrix elongata RA019]
MITLETAIAKIKEFPPEQRLEVIKFVEFLEFKIGKTNQTQQTVESKQTTISFTEAAKEFIGCLDSDLEDLSHNSKYMEGFR